MNRMCLGIPAQIEKIEGGGKWAVADTQGVKRKVGLHLVESVEPGDYIMVHAGYAIEKVDLEEARERIRIWEEFLRDECS